MRLPEVQLPMHREPPETRLAPVPAFSNTFLSRRRVLGGAMTWGALLAATAGCDSPRPAAVTGGQQRLRLIGEARWSHRQTVAGTPAGGLSAIDYDAAKGEYLLLSDDRSDLAPVRFYTAEWPAPAGDTPPNSGAVVFLQKPGGGPWPNRAHAVDGLPIPDPEALRLSPDTGTVLWTTEGDVARGFGPALYESTRDGHWLREFALPAMFRADPSERRGPRDNLGFEGLALTPDGRYAWLAMENALIQDGAVPTIGAAGGSCRFTQVDLGSGATLRQIAYQPDAIPLRPRIPGTYADNGVSEVLMLDAHRMLVLERAYAAGSGNSLRLYEIDTRGAGDCAHHRRAHARQPPAGHQDAGRRFRRARPLAPGQQRRHVLGPAVARWPAHAGRGERRQFQPAADHAVRRLRLHRQFHRPTMTIAATFLPRNASSELPPIAFIGGGNMASAIVGGLIRQGAAAGNFEIVEPFEDARSTPRKRIRNPR